MSFKLSEIGEVGQVVDVLRGGDVGPDGRLLTYYEIREALRLHAAASADHPVQASRQVAAPIQAEQLSLPDHLQSAWDRIAKVHAHEFSLLDTETFRQYENDHRELAAAGVRPPPAPVLWKTPVGEAPMQPDLNQTAPPPAVQTIPPKTPCWSCPVCAADV